MRNVVAGCRLMLCIGALGSCHLNSVSFLSYFLTLTPPVNGFAELQATLSLISELGCHLGHSF